MAVTGQMLVPSSAPSIASARHRLAREMQANGCVPSVVNDATIVLSELLSNAVRHARPLPSGKVLATWEIDSGSVRILVSDGGGKTVPAIKTRGIRSPGGRGLAIVEHLAAQWGVLGGSGGTTVWALVAAADAVD